ncbi:MAG: Hsp70 family protein [Planctomycetia bacterium]|nr:Hsp70 family protein [Planctomycetia bacterium]
MKWSLTSEQEVDLGNGYGRTPEEAVTDFVNSIVQETRKHLPKIPLNQAAVTIPVNFPLLARQRLLRAFKQAGVEITHFYFEPIAAIYAGLIAQPVSGVAAVFDWGGGSLDIAAVEVRNGIAQTREVVGWHRGGTHFDRLIAEQATNAFLSQHYDEPALLRLTADQILDRPPWGLLLLSQSNLAKEQLSNNNSSLISVLDFYDQWLLEYELTKHHFTELIGPDLHGSMDRLDRVLNSSLVTPRTLARLFLSGGTCNIQEIQNRLASDYGDRLTNTLQLPKMLKAPSASGGLDDIGNATAIGAAMLAGHRAQATYSADIGIRLADGHSDGKFLPVFKRGDRVQFDKPESIDLLVTNTSSMVARLLICDQTDHVTHPAGRLLRLITIPIDSNDKYLWVQLKVNRHLTLEIKAAGAKQLKIHLPPEAQEPTVTEWVQSLKLGFVLPTLTAQ